MNDLELYFNTMAKRPIRKWSNYFSIYDLHFDRFRGLPVNVLEIGIAGGGSLQMWKWYFGRKANIFGLDIDDSTLYKEARIKTFKCDSGSKDQLLAVMTDLPMMDIVIDDGGHRMEEQITAFETLYPLLNENGVYLCEDIHTSFYPEFGGGPEVKRTFLGYMKKQIDQLTAFHSRGQVKITDFGNSTHSISFYNSIVVIEKKVVNDPKKLIAKQKVNNNGKNITKPDRYPG